MGIQGLLPFLKEIRREIHLSELRGLRIAVDGYVWLHRAAFGCALELMQSHETSKYVDFFMRQVYILKEHEIEPVIVFDGAPLPMKRSTEIERRQRRDQQRAKGMQLLRAGKKLEAIECFQRSVNITPVMAYHVIKALKHREINFVVAPYEADAQMAYLERTGYVDAVLSEDSDLLVFGVKRLITKLDRGGNAIEICGDNIMRVSALAAQSWNFSKFRQMCIMSGCDYLASPHGIGLQKAAKFLENKRDAYQVIQSWINWGKAVKAPDLPPNYEESFRRAEWTFLHQRVFDPESRSLAYLTPLSLALTAEEERGLDFLGP
ncbi:PIN domain-like protein [Polychytrium aggregatum]|uniref:PIN domain-like protein n=1 Tax=Polychytrium aggregatum TaxID=110093 RepID=UPI0022FE162F|nr:PIN domain-like protein [Polychytrium aggregatum]KAI9205019.1 PIN domain-like protein [Polychytrium aggregatum]